MLVTMPLENAYALQASGQGPVYASALARLANQNLSAADPWVE